MVAKSTRGSAYLSFPIADELASRADCRDHLLAPYPKRIPEPVLEVPTLGIKLGTFFRTPRADFPLAS